MKKLLKIAARAWAGMTLSVKKFADAYKAAVEEHGDEAIEAFRAAYPMFGEREWKRIGAVADGRLLPQFMVKSDSFVGKLLRMPSSMRIQRALVGANNDGKIRVDRGNGPERVFLDDLTKKEQKALVMLFSEENEKLSADELMVKFRGLVRSVNKSSFAKRKSYKKMALELVDAIIELEALRDDEWDFEEQNGPRDLWSAEVEVEHSKLLHEIQRVRNGVQKLCREIKNDEKLEV